MWLVAPIHKLKGGYLTTGSPFIGGAGVFRARGELPV